MSENPEQTTPPFIQILNESYARILLELLQKSREAGIAIANLENQLVVIEAEFATMEMSKSDVAVRLKQLHKDQASLLATLTGITDALGVENIDEYLTAVAQQSFEEPGLNIKISLERDCIAVMKYALNQPNIENLEWQDVFQDVLNLSRRPSHSGKRQYKPLQSLVGPFRDVLESIHDHQQAGEQVPYPYTPEAAVFLETSLNSEEQWQKALVLLTRWRVDMYTAESSSKNKNQ